MIGRVLQPAGRLLVASLFLVALTGSSAILLGAVAWTPLAIALAIAVPAATWLRPVTTVAVLLAALPFFGNRPTTPQYLALIWVSSLVAIPLLVRLIRQRSETVAVIRSPIGLATLAYAGASLASLSSIPFDAIVPAAGVPSPPAGLLDVLRLLPRMDVLEPLYGVLTVVLTLQALVIALWVAVQVRARPERASAIVFALLAGLSAAVIVGLLDFHQIIDLRPLRDFDPVTNPLGVERLQSTFGHSGWLGQYVCFTTPAVLALLLWRPRRVQDADAVPVSWQRAQALAAGALLLASLVTIVLSYQRGGWITFLCVLLFVVLSWIRLGGVRDAGASVVPVPARRALLTLAAASIVAVLVAAATVMASGERTAARFADRVRYITHVSDRSIHIMAGLRLGALLPILGGGSETFAMRYREEYLLSGGEYYMRGYSPLQSLYGSAHNVFAQTFAGKGLAGLTALILVVLTTGAGVVRILRDRTVAYPTAVCTSVAAGTLLAFTVYGQVQEVFYIQALQLTVWPAFAIVAGVAARRQPEPRPREGIVAIVLLVVLAAHLVHAYGTPGRLREAWRDRQITRAGERLLPPERDRNGEYFQWTGSVAYVNVPRSAARFSAEVRRVAPFAQTVELRFDGRTFDRFVLTDTAWRPIAFNLPETTRPRRLEIHVSPVWRPDNDPRTLGIMIRRVDWGLPPAPEIPQ